MTLRGAQPHNSQLCFASAVPLSHRITASSRFLKVFHLLTLAFSINLHKRTIETLSRYALDLFLIENCPQKRVIMTPGIKGVSRKVNSSPGQAIHFLIQSRHEDLIKFLIHESPSNPPSRFIFMKQRQ